MLDQDTILNSCSPEFSDAWKHADKSLILAGGFITAACVMEYSLSGKARVLLAHEGFDFFFGKEEDTPFDDFMMMVIRQDRAHFADACDEACTSDEPVNAEVAWRVSVEGHGIPATAENTLRTTISILHVGDLDNGSRLLYLAMCNVTKRRHDEHALSRNQYASSLGAMFSEAFTIDLETGRTEVLFDSNCLEGQASHAGFHEISKRVHPDDRKMFWAHSNSKNIKRQLYCDNPAELLTFDLRRMESDGAYHWLSIFITRVANFEDRMKVLVCVRNLDAQKDAQRRERELRSKAETDALTGVYNRGATEDLIAAALEARRADNYLSLIVFDVDKFKRINDTYGHLMGDKLLKMVAKNLCSICREGDIVGRIGGDEFVALIISEVKLSSAIIGSRINHALEGMAKFSEKEGIDPPVTLSAGVVPITDDICTYAAAFAKADELMYETKQEGRNGYRLYHP